MKTIIEKSSVPIIRLIFCGCLIAGLFLCNLTAANAQNARQQRRLAKLEQQTKPAASSTPTTDEQNSSDKEPVIKPVRPFVNQQPGMGKVQLPALDRALLRLDLNEGQKVKIRTVRIQFVEQIKKLTTLRRAKAIVLDDALYGADFDPKEAEKKVVDLAATEGELLKAQHKMIIEVRQILTNEQALKLRQYLEEERARPLQNSFNAPS